MRPLHRMLLRLTMGLLALTFGAATTSGGERGAELAVVVSNKSSLDSLSLYQLKHLYLGDLMRGPSGDKLVPLNRGNKTPERIGFDESVLGMNPVESSRYWIDRRIRGLSGAPRAIDPASTAQLVLAKVPSAVSYVLATDVAPHVKVLSIDGKKPGDADYPVRAQSAQAGAVHAQPLWPLSL